MGIYKVQANGNAPSGLQVGDQVVTGGGTYLITGVNADGSYQSRLIIKNQTTYNFSGNYDTPSYSRPTAERGSSATAAPAASVNRSAEQAAAARYEELLRQTVSAGYQPLVQSAPQPAAQPAAPLKGMSFSEALALAEQVMEPQYSSRYQQAAQNSAQRLEQAGLYDTLYGQALAADAEKDISKELNAAIYSLALQLSNASGEQALDLLKMAVDEAKFGAEYSAEQRKTALEYLYKLMQA